jgi:hypothetical protein
MDPEPEAGFCMLFHVSEIRPDSKSDAEDLHKSRVGDFLSKWLWGEPLLIHPRLEARPGRTV